MKVTDLKDGEFCTRPNWGSPPSRGHLAIGNHKGTLFYYDRGSLSSKVRCNSTAYTYTDFTYCNQSAQSLPIKKEPNMTNDYEKTVILVTTSNNQIKDFISEEIALEWIAEKLEGEPRTKFKMFKPYQEIKPKRVDLSSLISKIIN